MFLPTPVDGSATSLVALALLLAVVAWARSPGHRDRWLAVEAATYISLLVIGIPLLAVRMSWWQGAFFISTPMVVLVAIYVPFSIAGCTLWLGPYRWLTGRTKHALVLYGVIVLASSSVVLQVDPVQMERGQFTTTGGDWRWEVQ